MEKLQAEKRSAELSVQKFANDRDRVDEQIVETELVGPLLLFLLDAPIGDFPVDKIDRDSRVDIDPPHDSALRCVLAALFALKEMGHERIEIARAFHEPLELTARAGPLVEKHQRNEVACVRFLRILAFAANLCASGCHV